MRKRKEMKKVLSLALTLMLMLTLVPMTATVNANSDFEIRNGVLTKYNGAGGDVVIPDGVTLIGNGSFMSTINIFLSSCFLLNWILAGVRYFNVRF